MFEVINSPWKDNFFEYIGNSWDSIKICSPFVKKEVVYEIYERKRENVKLELITNFNITSFFKGASDIDAMEKILDKNDKVKNYQSLHAKIYIFDSKFAIVTSANLTTSGLQRNYEYGVISDDDYFIKKVNNDYNTILNSELSGEIKKENIYEIRKILSNLRKDKKIKYTRIVTYNQEDENIDEVLVDETELIENTLVGWKLEVFKLIKRINKQIFELDDIYKFTSDLHKIYPGNKNIEAKIRQQLQLLRDLGLIKFLGNGVYKKLWL